MLCSAAKQQHFNNLSLFSFSKEMLENCERRYTYSSRDLWLQGVRRFDGVRVAEDIYLEILEMNGKKNIWKEDREGDN